MTDEMVCPSCGSFDVLCTSNPHMHRCKECGYDGTTALPTPDRYGDGALRGMWRLATAPPDTAAPEETWPAHVVANLIEEIIRLRGTDTAWLAVHPQQFDGEAGA